MSRQHDEIVDLLRQLTTRTDRWIDERGQQHGVHRTHLHALAHLMEAERAGRQMSPGELSEALGLSAPATTALVDRLVAAGHAERRTHPTDRRRTIIATTDAAAHTGSAIFAPLAVRLREVSSALDGHEREVVTRFLHAVVEQMNPDD